MSLVQSNHLKSCGAETLTQGGTIAGGDKRHFTPPRLPGLAESQTTHHETGPDFGIRISSDKTFHTETGFFLINTFSGII
jgi:hypothetical protein